MRSTFSLIISKVQSNIQLGSEINIIIKLDSSYEIFGIEGRYLWII